jgi:hypothetical protein
MHDLGEQEREVSVPEMMDADIGEDAFRFSTLKNTTGDHYTMIVLTPLSAPHAETASNHKQRNRLR